MADLEGEGLRVVSVTRRGGAFVPGPGTVTLNGNATTVTIANNTVTDAYTVTVLPPTTTAAAAIAKSPRRRAYSVSAP